MKREQWVKPEIRKAFEAKIVETIAKCQPHCKEIINVPKLVFRKIGGPAGRNLFNTLTRNSVVTINPAYFEKEGGYEEQLNKTLPHEVAHHVNDFIHGQGKHNRSHGWQWARVMRWIGLPAERCHKMDAEGIINRHERPYRYTCSPGCKHENIRDFTVRKHTKIQGMIRDGLWAKQYYFCKACRAKLVYVGIVYNGRVTPVAKPIPAPNNEIKTIRLAPRVIGVTFVPPAPKAEEPKMLTAQFKTVTRFVNGMLQNFQEPI